MKSFLFANREMIESFCCKQGNHGRFLLQNKKNCRDENVYWATLFKFIEILACCPIRQCFPIGQQKWNKIFQDEFVSFAESNNTANLTRTLFCSDIILHLFPIGFVSKSGNCSAIDCFLNLLKFYQMLISMIQGRLIRVTFP